MCRSPGDYDEDSVVTFYLVKKRVDADKVAVRHWSDRADSELVNIVAVRELVVAGSDGRVKRPLPLPYSVEACAELLARPAWRRASELP